MNLKSEMFKKSTAGIVNEDILNRNHGEGGRRL
jgi:hypothetical protein